MKLNDILVTEVLELRALNSGGANSKKAKDNVKMVTDKKETVMAGGKEWRVLHSLPGERLEQGDMVLASYSKGNQGAQVYEILGFSDDDEKYGDGGVKFANAKQLLRAKGVMSLAELEELQGKNAYGHHSYIVARDIDDKEEGPWFYVYKGKWSRGSGAEPLSFWEVAEVK